MTIQESETYQTSLALGEYRRYSFAEWQRFAGNLKERAKTCRNQIIDRMRETALQAGLDPQIAGLHAHNAMCSFHSGHPWPECDYSLVRRVLWLEEQSFVPERLAARIIERAWQRVAN